MEGSGEFEICESGSVAASGIIYSPADINKESLNLEDQKCTSEYLSLNKQDIYKDLRLRGYDYEGIFRGVTESDNLGKVTLDLNL